MNKPVYDAAFLVLIQEDGEVVATADLAEPFDTKRDASLGDIRRACTEVLYNIEKFGSRQNPVSVADKVAKAINDRRRSNL